MLEGGCRRGRDRLGTAKIVRHRGGRGLVWVAEGGETWEAAVNLEVIQLQGGLLDGGGADVGRRGGELEGVRVRVRRRAAHQRADAGQGRGGVVVLQAAHVHRQPGDEV